MKKNQWLLLLVVALVAALGYWLMVKGDKLSDLGSSATPSVSVGPTKAPAKVGATASPVAGSTKSYTELVKEYDGRRIQFNQDCAAIPNYITYKNGTSIMIDNRSGDARIVKVGSNSYSLQGYGYRIITLSSNSLPQELFLDCGSAVNVGKILLQAKLY
ncbi:MAG: hypothetical protein WD989_00835 [Candidatus Paceibacterota bacterium]